MHMYAYIYVYIGTCICSRRFNIAKLMRIQVNIESLIPKCHKTNISDLFYIK